MTAESVYLNFLDWLWKFQLLSLNNKCGNWFKILCHLNSRKWQLNCRLLLRILWRVIVIEFAYTKHFSHKEKNKECIRQQESRRVMLSGVTSPCSVWHKLAVNLKFWTEVGSANPPSHAHTFHLHEPAAVDMGKRKSCGSQVLMRCDVYSQHLFWEARMLSARHKLCSELEMYFVCTHIFNVFSLLPFISLSVHYFPLPTF